MVRRFETPKQKKSLGQVFLRTDWPVKKVVEKVLSWQARRVIEIGPGGGILTRALLEAGIDVTAVEKDERFVERLEEYNRERGADARGKLTIVSSDILRFDLEKWLDSSGDPAAVVGNIPYNISSPIVQWVLPHLDRLKGVNFLVQLEFAQRLAGSADSKEYGSLSVYAQLRAAIELDCKVDRTCFNPVPKVDSALVTLRKKPPIYSEELLKKAELVTQSAFTQRRKKLRNAVRVFMEDDSQDQRCPIDLNRRPDSLRPEEFVQLTQFLFPGVK